MADTIRIRTTPNGEDKYIKINVEQNLILLRFCQNYPKKMPIENSAQIGVIVGRVSVNNGFGVPNAMVSVLFR
jgi:hypothetical protein